MKKAAKFIMPYTDEARNYDISNYPSVRINWRCDETTGNFITDEVSGTTIDPSGVGGSIAFGSPAYSIQISASQSFGGANFPVTLPADKFYMMLLVMRCANVGGVPAGSVSQGNQWACGVKNGEHFTFLDILGNGVYSAPDTTKQLTAGTDYIMTSFVRPTGQNCGLTVYDLNGSIVNSSVSPFAPMTITGANPGMTDIQLLIGGYGTGNSVPWYHKILYQFDSEPSDLLTAIKWHGACAPIGIKGPYPAWKGKT